MKNLLFVFFVGVIFISCSRNDNNEVSILCNNDTINDGEIYTAELSVKSIESILPKFYIIRDLDTFRLPIDEKKRCAVFRAVGRGYGEKEYKGFVEYIDNKGNRRKLAFKINFFVTH